MDKIGTQLVGYDIDVAKFGVGESVRVEVGKRVAVPVNVGIAFCVSTNEVLASAMAVSITSVGFVLTGETKPLHDVNSAIRNKKRIVILMAVFTFF